jgi:hypothetical protein
MGCNGQVEEEGEEWEEGDEEGEKGISLHQTVRGRIFMMMSCKGKIARRLG